MEDRLKAKLEEAAREAGFIICSADTMAKVTTMTLDTIAEYLEENEPGSTGSIQTLHEAAVEVTVHLGGVGRW